MKIIIVFILLISNTAFSQVKVKVDVPGMVCQMCVFGMKKNFSEVVEDKEKDVIVDLELKTVTVHLKEKISEDEINKELRLLNVQFQKYRKEKIKEVDEFKIKRNRNITNFLNLINPLIEKYMADNSIYMLIDKKNVFIAKKEYDITNNLIELINNQIKNIEIK